METLRTLLYVLLLTLFFASSSSAAVMFTTTINETEVPTVQETIIDVLSPKGFTPADIGSNKIALTPHIGDGFFIAIRNRTVVFTLLQQGENVRMMVLQNEIKQGIVSLRNIEHLIPLIQEVRHIIDGTPIDLIVDESPASGETVQKPEEAMGLTLSAADGVFIAEVAEGSAAMKIGLRNGDIVHEINGKALIGMKEGEVGNYIAETWQAGSPLVIMYEREGEKDLLSL